MCPDVVQALAQNVCQLDGTPKEVLDAECAMDEFLGVLYSPLEKYKFRNRQIDVGGVTIFVTSFHYPLSNIEAPTNTIRREYVDEADQVTLFSYELKAVICRRTKQVYNCL